MTNIAIVHNYGVDPIADRTLVSNMEGYRSLSNHGNVFGEFLNDTLLPKAKLTIIRIPNINELYQAITGKSLGFLGDCRGLYLTPNHMRADENGYIQGKSYLQKNYNISLESALVIPYENAHFSTFIHEGLHNIFAQLDPSIIDRILTTADNCFNTYQSLQDMLKITHFNTTHLTRDINEIREIGKENEVNGLSSLDGFDNFFVFSKLLHKEKLMIIDEYIANFFTNNRVTNKQQENFLPSQFKNILNTIGYKTDLAL